MKALLRFLIISILFSVLISAQGNIYFILGSDTAIWDGMDVAKYNCYYNNTVIPDNTRNYYEVMQPSYRSKFSDSYGNSVKFTWWLMSGNIFRFATNKNVPYPNMIVPYQAKYYFGKEFEQFKDELTLHYHTFAWTDYDNNGKYYWNQAKNFSECKDDFYYTLAQMLIEEKIFPVSFRSGWNHMNNEWQAELDKLLLYSMHNEAPAYRTSTTEPIDNVYDWRLATKEFIPYRPSPDNYQLPGNGRGWNLHSKNIGNITQNDMNSLFIKAKTTDQVVCLWGHVWDDQFPESALKINELANNSAKIYTDVKFRYCSAIEAMQEWRKNNDREKPVINFSEMLTGDKVKFVVESNEPIFQLQPFVAVKQIDESYTVVQFDKLSNTSWISKNSFIKKNIAKAGIAVTDTMGNQTIKIIDYLPDDIILDNESAGYTELTGSFSTVSKSAWGINSRKAVLSANDSLKTSWISNVKGQNHYNFFVQFPKDDLLFKNFTVRIITGNKQIFSKNFFGNTVQNDWLYVTTNFFETDTEVKTEIVAQGTGQENKIFYSGVIKITPLVKLKSLTLNSPAIDMGEIIIRDSTTLPLELFNNGMEKLTVTEIRSKNGFINSLKIFPLEINAFEKVKLPYKFYASELGNKTDTLIIKSDDPFNPEIKIAVTAAVTNYFSITDNETVGYSESSGWSASVAQAYGGTSRFAYLNQTPRAYAVFSATVRDEGQYNISFIVPKTVNAANKALYVIQQGGRFTDSVYVDQNQNSGNWILLVNRALTTDQPVTVKVIDNGKSTAGPVLRADAVRFAYTGLTSVENEKTNQPVVFQLKQNYPNPFNPSTRIDYQLPNSSFVTLKIFDILGREIATLVNEQKNAGNHSSFFTLNSSLVSSGIYFYQIKAVNNSSGGGQSFIETKKMIYMK